MIPATTRFGYLFNLMESDISFPTIDAVFRKQAKRIRRDEINGSYVYDYITKKGIFGPLEIITVSHRNGEVQLVGVKSKDPEEYHRMAGIIREASPMINLVQDIGNSEIYKTCEGDFVFQIGQNVFQKGDNVLIAMRNE